MSASLPPRQLPALEPGAAFFWQAGEHGQLKICRCQSCQHYIHPPLPRCPVCGSEEVQPEAVSGKARVASFTINYQAWTRQLTEPYVFAAVELVEQPELYVFTNIVDCPVDNVEMGMAVSVQFEHQADVWLPLFAPVDAAEKAAAEKAAEKANV